MYQFVCWLRVLAAALITNAHYEEVYPLSILANGGLLGDVLFFALSGFCLFPVKKKLITWYGGRLKRIYPSVWIITAVYMLLRFYPVTGIRQAASLLFYPTYYHFVASILLLYFLFFVVAKYIVADPEQCMRRFAVIASAAAAAYLLLYWTVYDRSYYHIDSVHEPMIRFLFFGAMLIGMYCRIHVEQVTRPARFWHWCAAGALLPVYFASKLLFARGLVPCVLQWVNQILLLALLFFLFRCIAGLEDSLKKAPVKVRSIVGGLAGMTLEIYLVQYALIPRLNIGPFPFNYLLVSGGIFAAAWILRFISTNLVRLFERRKHHFGEKT